MGKDYAYITVDTFNRAKGREESSNLMQHFHEGFTIMSAVGAGNGVVHYVLERPAATLNVEPLRIPPQIPAGASGA